MTPGPLQILLIIVLVLLLFGAGKVPSIMENMAKGIRSFKRGLNDDDPQEKDKDI
jgi:sec-independent protein translocase protein TatA